MGKRKKKSILKAKVSQENSPTLRPKRKLKARIKDDDSLVPGIFDPEGAAADEALMRHLSGKLGIKGQRGEQKIFADLGFGDDVEDGIEELPSSGEEDGEVV